uniref:Uncharacterized protein n=1 Tax=Glossina pallidipes TaxID=7398 RepID=A0A1A9ZHW7_GLOPL
MVENYLLLLTSKEREAVQNYLQRLTSNDSAVMKYEKLLKDILKENPYPVIQVLLLNWSTHKEQIKSVLLQALEQLLEDVLAEKCLDKFLIYLIESPAEIFENLSENSKNNLKCILLEASRKSEFYLCLLSHKDENLITDIVKLLKDTIWQNYQQPLPSTEYILYQAMEKKTHFITLIIKNLNEFKHLPNELRCQFLILRLIDKFSNYNQELAEIISLMPLIEELDLSKLPEDYQPVYEHFFKKFEILLNICNFIQRQAECRDCMQIRNVLETNSILEMIVKWRLKGSYAELKNFLVKAYERENNSLLDKELNVFNYYYCLTIIYDLITDTATNEKGKDLFTRKVQLLTVFLRQQKDLESLCQLLEDITQMVFLRYDVMNTESITIQKNNRKSSDTSYTDADDEHIDKPYKRALKSISKPTSGNFLCRGKVLYQIFNFLKLFITKKLHSDFYKMASKELQKRFQNILDYINNILWKYDIVENLQQGLNNANKAKLGVLQLREEKIFQLIKPHKIAMEKDTSDEDDGDNQIFENSQSHYFSRVSRRKANKKYRRATFSGTINTHTEDALTLKQSRARAKTLVNTLLSNGNEKFKSATKFNVNLIMERSIIPKILGTPEQLVITAMSLKNFNEAKRIIKNFNLQTTSLNIDINHVEQQQQIRQKLLAIYESYQETEQHLENMAEPTT